MVLVNLSEISVERLLVGPGQSGLTRLSVGYIPVKYLSMNLDPKRIFIDNVSTALDIILVRRSPTFRESFTCRKVLIAPFDAEHGFRLCWLLSFFIHEAERKLFLDSAECVSVYIRQPVVYITFATIPIDACTYTLVLNLLI